jgi:hypothetical protein
MSLFFHNISGQIIGLGLMIGLGLWFLTPLSTIFQDKL